jgi:uncharacterized protein
MSQILDALHRGDHQRVGELLAGSPELNVFEAAALGDAERMRVLVEGDPALANAFAPDGFFPLALAAFFGHQQAVDVLLEHGADVNAHARNPMQVCAIHAAVAHRHLRIVESLLARGANVNARQQGGCTALHAAAQHGDEPLMALLAGYGADPDAVDDRGARPADLVPARSLRA